MQVADILQIEIEAESLAEAIERGMRHFRCSRAAIEARILQAPSSGFIGLFGRKPAKVRIALMDRGFAARAIVERLISLSGFTARVAGETMVPPYLLKLDSADPSLLIGRHGQTLDSLQFLLNALLDKQLGPGESVLLDVAAYRERRQGDLATLAQRLIGKARRTGKTVSTPPLPIEERKVLYGLIEREPDIVAHSRGQGAEKKLVVSAHRG